MRTYWTWAVAFVLLPLACGGNSTLDDGQGAGTSSSTSTNTSSGGGASSSSGEAGQTSTSSSGQAGAGGGGQSCTPACSMGLECCNGLCVNKANDVKNCGQCGKVCTEANPFCDGECQPQPPCSGTACVGTKFCCGTECCDVGMLCCVVNVGPTLPPTCTPPNEHGSCPPGCPECVCASPDTPIETPSGARPIAELREGELVYSIDGGIVRAVPISRINQMRVKDHRVLRVVLDNGKQLEISAAHPTADGRSIGDLRPGDSLHGVNVALVSSVPYQSEFTYDILPDSDTGTYFSNGALIGSTLKGRVVVPPACFAP